MADAPQYEWTEQDRKIHEAALAGFPAESERIADDLRALDYFHLRGGDRVPFRRGESRAQWESRPRQTHPLTRRVVKILCSMTYSPGPARSIEDDEAASAELEEVYRDNMIDQVMGAADEMATLLGVAAVQVADLGGASLKPIKLYLWDRSQLILYPAPDDPTKVAHVITRDVYDEQRRYTWWTPRFYRTYWTDKLTPGQTSGGVAARFVPSRSGPNPYGRLPFGLIFNELPTTTLVPPGLGCFLADRNAAIDVKIDRMDAAVNAYHTPRGYVYNAPAGWNPSDPDYEAGDFIRVPPYIADEALEPRIEFPQPQLDVESGHLDVEKTIDTVMEGLGVPQTLYRMNQASLPSGESQKAEQQPLVDYTDKRRELMKAWETDLAEAILAVKGVAYGQAGSVEAGTRGLNLTLRWPPEDPTLEQMQADEASLQDESKSLVMVVQERFRYASRDEAVQHLQRVADDNAELKRMDLGPQAAADRRFKQQQQLRAAEPPPAPTNPEPPGGPSHGQ